MEKEDIKNIIKYLHLFLSNMDCAHEYQTSWKSNSSKIQEMIEELDDLYRCDFNKIEMILHKLNEIT